MTFAEKLNEWYQLHKRDLPWRETKDAYIIWLSEIILQQTRVEQGMPYFFKFKENFPDVRSFAGATEDQVLHLWQGLGYYSRGRNMLKTAQKVVSEFNGHFPTDYKELLTLTGIGDYTAAAISSFAANEARAVVDGNVYRFLGRYYGVSLPINSTEGKKYYQALADELLDRNNPGEHNQAMIEFGALQCKPAHPLCHTCPFQDSCLAYQKNEIGKYPVKLKKLKIKERFLYYFVVINNDEILIKRRSNTDIWAGLHDFPTIEFNSKPDFQEILKHPTFQSWFPKDTVIVEISREYKHILTHQRLFAQFVKVNHINAHVIMETGSFWVPISSLHQYAMPKLIFDFVKNFIN